MTNRRERKREFRQPNPWRRLLAFLCAFELLISVSGETAYAKNDNIIYSAPVTAPIRKADTPQPEEAAETPAPEVTTVYTEENTENNPETEEPTETETTAENPDDNHNEQEEMPLAEDTAGDPEDIPAGEETDIETEEKTETGNEGEETETAEAAGEEAVTEENKEEIPPAPEKNYTSGNLQAETEGCSVQINYTEAACIPDETTLTVTQARGADLYAALKSAAKVIRNEEDEIWKRQIADEGNAFYLLSLTDAEGNEVYPGAQVELILEQKNRPDGTTCFLTGENARILDEEEGKISVTDYSMEPVGYATIQLIQTGIVTKEYSGADYIVTASYGPEANFPANTEMKVREIRPDSPEYALYSGLTEEALAEEWNEITLERYFDITFISGGKEVEPSGNVDVQIVFKDVIELTEEHDIQAVHFENKEAVVIESETDSIDEEAKRSEEVIDTVSFTSDSFSVFGVVQRTKITQKMLAADGNTYLINVTYNQDSGLPVDAELVVTELLPGNERYDEYLQKAVRAALNESDDGEVADEDQELFVSEDQYARFFDIEIRSGDQKIEPEGNVSVSITLADAPEDRLEDLMIVHFTGENANILEAEVDTETGIQFTADSFSVYGVITMPVDQPQTLQELDGRTFVFNHNGQYLTKTVTGNDTNQFLKTSNANQATVWTFEATDQDGVYYIFTTDTQGNKQYMNLISRDTNNAHAALSISPQAFTVSQENGGYTFSATSGNSIYYLNEFNRGAGFAGWYARNTRDDIFNLEFKNPVVQNDKQYMMLVKYNGQYYIVNNDGSLSKVEYNAEKKSVIVDNPMMWTINKNGNRMHIYFNSEATGYDWQDLASDYYRRYLDGNESNALKEENRENVQLNPTYDPSNPNGDYRIINRDQIWNETELTYYDQHLYHEPWYENHCIGVEVDSIGTPVCLIGNQPVEKCVDIFFADATEVRTPEARNHAVNHIDISIAGNSRVNVPLAYGTYYYEDPDTHEMVEYNVTTNKTLDLSAAVTINSEDMKHATIKAYDKNYKELNDAFVVNGYSSNAHTNISTNQVRIEGSFKVADLDPIPEGQDPESQEVRDARLSNQITYVVSAIKNLDFDMIDPQRGQLYEKQADGTFKKLSINMDVDMTASFQYYDAQNECPPLQPEWGDGYNNWLWTNGGIPGGSGMDFILGGDAEAANSNVVAIEVTKQIIDESGKLIHPARKIIHTVGIYGNTEKDENGFVANANSVSDLNVGQYTTDYTNTGYTKIHSKDIAVGPTGMTVVYDYAIHPGMYYVTEDKRTVAESFEDTAGDIWEYKETYITTEYVRRGDKYDNKTLYPDPLHYSKHYTFVDDEFASVPEVVGTFIRLDNAQKKNGIQEYYVYNVYVNRSTTSLEVEKTWADGTTIPQDADVTFELYYAKRLKTNHGELIETPEDWPDFTDYQPVEGDPIFDNGLNTTLTVRANESDMLNWKGIFTGMPKTWKDSDDNDWELDYYAKEIAVTVNNRNIIDQYSQESVKEEAASSNSDNSDGKVTITNTSTKTRLTVKKEWPDDQANHYEGDSVELKLIRYKKDAPLPPAKGTLNISHIAEGLNTTDLPTGFEVTYSYEGPESTSGVTAGSYEVLAGEYIVYATITNTATPYGYTYVSTNGPITVNVPSDGSGMAEFISSYTKNTQYGTISIIHNVIGGGLSSVPSGFVYTATDTEGHTYLLNTEESTSLPWGTYTINVSDDGVTHPAGYTASTTFNPSQVTLNEENTDSTVSVTTKYTRPVNVTVERFCYGQTRESLTGVFDAGSKIKVRIRRPDNSGPILYYRFDDNGQWEALSYTMTGHYYPSVTVEYEFTIPDQSNFKITIFQNDYAPDAVQILSIDKVNTGKLLTKQYRLRASAGVTSGGMRTSSSIPEDYGKDEWFESITLNRNDDWTFEFEGLDIYDEYGEPYYYAVEEMTVAGYQTSYNPSSPVIATQTEEITLTVSNELITDTKTDYKEATIYKTDGVSPLAGAVFALLNGTTTVKTYTMGDNTSFDICTDDPDLASILPAVGESITLTLKETTPPSGYKTTTATWPVEISTTRNSAWNADHTAWTTTTTYNVSVNGQSSLTVPNTPIRTISVTKLVTDCGTPSDALSEKIIRFGLFTGDTEPGDNATPAEGCIGEIKISGESTSKVLFENLDPGTYWVYELDEQNHPLKHEASLKFDGDTYTIREEEPSVTLVKAGDEKNVTITNNKEGTGSLTVKKMLAGEDAIMTDRFHFIITQTSEPKINGTYGDLVFTDGVATCELGHEESANAEGLPYGFTYTITEEEADQNDYITVTVLDSNLTVEIPGEEGEEPEIRDEADYFIKTDETETITVTNTRMLKKSIRVTKEYMGIPKDETDSLPAVSFTLWQVRRRVRPEGPGDSGNQGWGHARRYEQVDDDENDPTDYNNIILSYENNWTWECKVELPDDAGNGEEYGYFVVENPVRVNGDHGVGDLIRTNPLIERFPIFIEGYQYRDVKDVGRWSRTVHYNQPFNSAVHNHGEIKILNKMPGYMQMDLKKKFLEYRPDGTGNSSLYTTTGESENMRNMIIKLQMMRIIIDDSSGQDVFLSDWEEYGNPFLVGYDTSGRVYIDNNENAFEVVNRGGSWHFQVAEDNIHHGLPTKGLYRKENNDIIVVRYRYIFKEIQVYDGSLNPKGGQWNAWLPYAKDGNGRMYKVSELQTAQDQDRMLNVPGASLSVEKEWIGSSRNYEEVYVKVSRREYGSSGDFEDYLSVLSEEMELGNLAQDHFGLNNINASVLGTFNNQPVLVLNDANGWKTIIDKVQVFPNGNNQKQYEYRIDEIGYKDKNGNVFGSSAAIITFEPAYSKQGENDSGWVEMENGLRLTTNGPNKLKVTNTAHYGALEIIKEVHESSTVAADGMTFTFEVNMTLPEGAIFNQYNLSVEDGSITNYVLTGNNVKFSVTRLGTGSTVIDGIPYGTTYTVTETNVPTGWQQVNGTVYSDSGKEIARTDIETDKVTITNREITSVLVEKVWQENGQSVTWPEEVASITVGLYHSADGEELPVLNEDETPKTLTFVKDTNPEGRTFSGLPVYDEGEPVYDDDGKPVPITYTIHELSVAPADDPTTATEVTEEGTVTIGDYTWIVSVGEPVNGLTTITNSRMEIHILKVDIETDPKEPLLGAKFMLKRKNTEGQYVTVTGYEAIEVDENGKADIRNLEDGDYRLLETKAPAGYIPMGMPVEFTVTNGAVASFEDTEYVTYNANNQTFTIGNKAGLALPSTGGSGTLPYTAGGLSLILMAVLLKLMKKRRKNYQ